MKSISFFILLIVFSFNMSCSSDDTKDVTVEKIVYVDSKQEVSFDQVHNLERPYLRVKFDDKAAEWSTISDISGFEYEEGYFYKLRIFETRIDQSNLAEDQPPIVYRLIEVISKEKDSEK